MIHLRPRIDRLSPETEEGIAARLAHQWAVGRDVRRAQPAPVTGGPSNFNRAQVPWGVDLAAAWAWRLLMIAAAGYVLLWLLAYFAVVTIPIAVALLTFAGQQVANGATDLADQTVQGLDEVKNWLKDGPLHASDSQINDYIDRAQQAITDRTKEGAQLSRITEVGTAVGHVLAGFFIVLFSTYFFLADGGRIWAWLVRIAPRAAREHTDASGRVAWISLTQFVRATVIVAATDAMGVMIGAAVLGVPFVLAIGVLVFLGAFVPMIGATIA